MNRHHTSTNKAPAPRLEFRWRQGPKTVPEQEIAAEFGAEAWFCDYGLVLPLQPGDIRAEGADGASGEVFFRFDTTPICGKPDDGYTPERDREHASRDSAALGDLPVWVRSASGHHAPRRTK